MAFELKNGVRIEISLKIVFELKYVFELKLAIFLFEPDKFDLQIDTEDIFRTG